MISKKWLKQSNNIYRPVEDGEMITSVDTGIYKIRYDPNSGYFLFKMEHKTDELLEFPSGVHNKVLNEIKAFGRLRENFKNYGFSYKRGVLLHGPPGSGKTCTIALCVKHYLEVLNGVIFTISDITDLEMFSNFVPEVFRLIEPSRPILVTIEDLDGLCGNSSIETMLLNLLDGFNQFEDVVYLATTNYIENLKARIINRPSRFDKRIYVPYLDYSDREYFFSKKLKTNDIEKIDLSKWCNDTEGMSIAHLSELIKLVFVFEASYEDSIKELKELMDTKNLSSINYEKLKPTPIGFHSKEELIEVNKSKRYF